MRVRIDYDVCMGDGNCHRVCPEVFDYDDGELHGVVKVDTVPLPLEGKVRRAAEECNPGAILLEE
jgi:ferredoxin